MKRNLFVLVFSLMLLSFGLSYAGDVEDYGILHFSVTPSVTYGGDTIPDNTPVTLAISISMSPQGAVKRITWSSPFGVTGSVASVAWADTSLYLVPAFGPFWDLLPQFSWSQNWVSGPLSATEMIFNVTGGGNNAGIPTNWSGVMCNLIGTFTLPDPLAKGQVCVGRGHPSNPIYDWLFDEAPANEPLFPPQCFPIAHPPNFPPSFIAAGATCGVEKSGQWHAPMTANFVAVDVESNDITYSKAGGVGTVTAGGAWSYQPTCQDVGQSLNVDVFAADPTHTALPGDAVQHCVMNVVVLNTAPEITDGCGTKAPIGLAGGTAQMTATDANIGDTKAWSIASISPATTGSVGIDAAGLLTFVPSAAEVAANTIFTIVVRVADCAGDFDECEVIFPTVAEMPYTIKIAKVEDAFSGFHSYVDVIKMAGSEDMLGFDFLFAYDASVLTFISAAKGPLFTMPGVYEWEYFTYRFGPNGNCGNACPSGLLRVIGLAEQNDGIHHPLELTVPDGTVLFTLDFLVSSNRLYNCQYAPVRFYWMDCGDNTIAFNPSTAGDPNVIVTAISKDVYEFWGGASIANIHAGFPTYLGSQAECDTPDIQGQYGLKPGTRPFIDFINGGIDIICNADIDDRGDINLNGLDNEIGDAVVFTNYFIKGLAAFTVNVEGQIQATDVNADGLVLSVADLVYLIRVIVGDALPYADKLSPYATTANFSTNGSVISTDVTLGAVLFTFNGIADVNLGSGAANMELKSGVVNGNTQALVLSYAKGQTCTGEILNANGSIKSIEAVDYYGTPYKVVTMPTAFSVKNYPNPFNPTANIEFTLPAVTDWTVSIYNVAGQKVAGFNGSGQGTVTLTWDASNVSSGIYFYKVEAGKNSATKKMVLMK